MKKYDLVTFMAAVHCHPIPKPGKLRWEWQHSEPMFRKLPTSCPGWAKPHSQHSVTDLINSRCSMPGRLPSLLNMNLLLAAKVCGLAEWKWLFVLCCFCSLVSTQWTGWSQTYYYGAFTRMRYWQIKPLPYHFSRGEYRLYPCHYFSLSACCGFSKGSEWLALL